MTEPQRFGRYELVTQIGRGGMAELWLGRLLGFGGFSKLVAIKRILPHLVGDPRFVQMFLNEGRIAARLSHPNVCHVYELGEADGELFLAMEYLEGVAWGELVDHLPADPAHRLALVGNVLGQACTGLAYAHELDIVHRDVSPHNLFVTVDGTCKLLDFGVSKLASDGEQTRSGLVKGKLPYMPPEQVRGEEVDARADVWAAGVVLWESLSGDRLFVRDNDYMIWKAIAAAPIPPRAGRFGAASDAVIAAAVERDVARRTPTIHAFGHALARAAAPCSNAELAAFVRRTCAGRLAEREGQVAAATQIISSATEPVEVPSETKSVALRGGSVAIGRRARGRLAALVLAGAAVGGVGLAIAMHGGAAGPVVPDARVVVARTAPSDAAVVVADAPAAEPEEIEIEDPGASSSSGSVRRSVRRVASGYFSIDSRPYATIYIDGKKRDQTPLFHVALPAGRHQIRAVRADGRQKTFAVQIDPGKDVSSGTLTW
ncbi:MAG: protein kinase domain-containing protein [Acidobacteriota bacterium]